MRALVILVLLFVGWLGLPAIAAAQDYSDCGNEAAQSAACPSRPEADANAKAFAQKRVDQQNSWNGCAPYSCTLYRYEESQWSVGYCLTYGGGTMCESGSRWVRTWSVECPNGEPWNDQTRTCGDPCGDKKGQSHPAGFASSFNACSGGCELKQKAAAGICVNLGGKDICPAPGGYEYTGKACTVSPEPAPPEEKPEVCTPVDGQTLCVKPDGTKCATASNGRQLCWGNGETGERTERDTRADAQAGPTHTPPNPQLPNGDNLVLTGGPTVVTTTTTNTTTNTTSTNTTNITTHRTQHGTNAGTRNQGTDTGGTSGGGNGEGEGDGPGASGGGSCEQPPVVTGDPALNMVANQAWATRCAVEAGNAAKVSGDIGNCKQPFTVEGTNANAVKLRAMRKQICPAEGETEPDKAGYLGEDDTATRDALFGNGTEEIGADGLDQSGFGWGSSCPAIPTVTVFGKSITFDGAGVFCDFLTLGGWFVLTFAGLICLRILSGIS